MSKISLSGFEEIIENTLYSRRIILGNEKEAFNAEQVFSLNRTLMPKSKQVTNKVISLAKEYYNIRAGKIKKPLEGNLALFNAATEEEIKSIIKYPQIYSGQIEDILNKVISPVFQGKEYLTIAHGLFIEQENFEKLKRLNKEDSSEITASLERDAVGYFEMLLKIKKNTLPPRDKIEKKILHQNYTDDSMTFRGTYNSRCCFEIIDRVYKDINDKNKIIYINNDSEQYFDGWVGFSILEILH